MSNLKFFTMVHINTNPQIQIIYFKDRYNFVISEWNEKRILDLDNRDLKIEWDYLFKELNKGIKTPEQKKAIYNFYKVLKRITKINIRPEHKNNTFKIFVNNSRSIIKKNTKHKVKINKKTQPWRDLKMKDFY